MKKRFFTMFLTAMLAVGTLTACGNSAAVTPEVSDNETVSEAIVESKEDETMETTESTEIETVEVEEDSEEQQEDEVTENSEAVEELVESAEIETVESEANSEEPTEVDVPTENSAAVSEEPESSEAAFTYTDLSKAMYAKTSVNVRNLPSTDGSKIGSLKTNDEVQVTGQCNETGWYRITYGDGEAYVSNKYLDDNKVEVAQPAQNTASDNSGGGTKNSSNPCPYTLWEPVDNGDSFSWYVVQPVAYDSSEMDTQRWMFDTLAARASEKSNDFYTDQTAWEFVGTYDEGNVYYQVISIVYR